MSGPLGEIEPMEIETAPVGVWVPVWIEHLGKWCWGRLGPRYIPRRWQIKFGITPGAYKSYVLYKPAAWLPVRLP